MRGLSINNNYASMQDKEKIKQALLKFATSLGSDEAVALKQEKHDVVAVKQEKQQNFDTVVLTHETTQEHAGDFNKHEKQKKHDDTDLKQEKKSVVRDKDKIKQALLRFATLLGTQENQSTAQALNKYTQVVIESDTTQDREQVKQQVFDAFNQQLQSEQSIDQTISDEQKQLENATRVDLLDQYMTGIADMFDSKTSNTQPEALIGEDVQRYIDNKINTLNEQLTQLRISNNHVVDGGGGSVAKQLVEGGVIEGNLKIEGRKKDPSRYSSPEALEMLNQPALTVNQNVSANAIAEFARDGDVKVNIDNGGVTTITQSLSVYDNLYVGGSIQGIIDIIPGETLVQDLIPQEDNVYNIGDADHRYTDIYTVDVHTSNLHTDELNATGNSVFWSDVRVFGDLYVSGNTYLSAASGGEINVGDDDDDYVVFNADIASDLIPAEDSTYSIGSSAKKWDTLHVDHIQASDNISTGSLSVTGVIDLQGALNVADESTFSGHVSARSLTTDSLTAGGLIYPTTDGQSRDALITDGNGNITFGAPNRLYLNIRNEDSNTLTPGKPIYALGEVGSSGVIRVGCADYSDPAKMPAIGLVTEVLAPNATGSAVINGVWNYNLTGVTGIRAGDTLYVGANELTNIKPVGADKMIQNIGQVLRVNGNGTVIHGIKVSSIDRSNDVPNLSAGHIFYSSNGATEQTSLTAAISAQSTINTQALNVTGPLLSAGTDLNDHFQIVEHIHDDDLDDQKVIDSFHIDDIKCAKYTICVDDTLSNNVYYTELSVVSNALTANHQLFGTTHTTPASFVSFDTSLNVDQVEVKIAADNSFADLSACTLQATRHKHV